MVEDFPYAFQQQSHDRILVVLAPLSGVFFHLGLLFQPGDYWRLLLEGHLLRVECSRRELERHHIDIVGQ